MQKLETFLKKLNNYYKREEKLIFISSNDNKYTDGKIISVNDLFKQPFIVTEKEGICYKRLNEISARYNCNLFDSVEVDSVYVITELVKKGMGLGFLPEYSVIMWRHYPGSRNGSSSGYADNCRTRK